MLGFVKNAVVTIYKIPILFIFFDFVFFPRPRCDGWQGRKKRMIKYNLKKSRKRKLKEQPMLRREDHGCPARVIYLWV